MFFLYANFQLSQKCHFYQLLWDTPFQECFWSRLINCCLFIKHYILNIDITRQLTFFRCFQLLEKEPRAETVLDIKEAIAPASETMLSFRALDGTDPRLWKWTVHLENKVCFLKILTHGEVNRMICLKKTSGFICVFSFRSPKMQGVELICLKNSSSLGLKLFISQGHLTKVSSYIHQKHFFDYPARVLLDL